EFSWRDAPTTAIERGLRIADSDRSISSLPAPAAYNARRDVHGLHPDPRQDDPAARDPPRGGRPVPAFRTAPAAAPGQAARRHLHAPRQPARLHPPRHVHPAEPPPDDRPVSHRPVAPLTRGAPFVLHDARRLKPRRPPASWQSCRSVPPS